MPTISFIHIFNYFKDKCFKLDKVPTKQTTKQWSVQVDVAEQGNESIKPKKGTFDTYSLRIDKLGNDVLSVEVHMFRNEPNSTTKYALFGCPDENDCNKEHFERAISLAKQLNEGIPYQFANFPLAEKATELEVEIVWTEKENAGRPLKERFIFTVE